MAHPHLGTGLYAIEKMAIGNGTEVGPTVLADLAAFHVRTSAFCYELGTVANGEHGELSQDAGQIRIRCVGLVNAAGTTAEDDAFDARIACELLGLAEGMDLAVDI